MIFILALCFFSGLSAQETATIIVNSNHAVEIDSVEIEVMVPYGTWSFPNSSIKYKLPSGDIPAKFVVKTYASPVYFSLRVGGRYFSGNIVESRDSLHIEVLNNELNYRGRGALKNQIIEGFRQRSRDLAEGMRFNDPILIKREFIKRDEMALLKIKDLRKFKEILGPIVFTMIQADIVGENCAKYSYLLRYVQPNEMGPFISALQSYEPHETLVDIKSNLLGNPISAHSSRFTAALIEEYRFFTFFINGMPENFKKIVRHFSALDEGPLKERLLFYLIYRNKRMNEAITSIDDVLEYIRNPLFANSLSDLKSAYNNKNSLANYTLRGQNGQIYNLSELKGQVVVMDFWYTGCPACPEIVPFLSKLEDKFQGKQVRFVSVSIDKDINKWRKSVASGLYTTDNGLHLFSGERGKSHPLIKDFFITAYPTILVFDRDGHIARIPRDPRQDGAQDLTYLLNELLK